MSKSILTMCVYKPQLHTFLHTKTWGSELCLTVSDEVFSWSPNRSRRSIIFSSGNRAQPVLEWFEWSCSTGLGQDQGYTAVIKAQDGLHLLWRNETLFGLGNLDTLWFTMCTSSTCISLSPGLSLIDADQNDQGG